MLQLGHENTLENDLFFVCSVIEYIGRVTKKERGQDIVSSVVEIYTSWISAKIDNYNSSMFFENPDYIFRSYILGEPINDSHVAV